MNNRLKNIIQQQYKKKKYLVNPHLSEGFSIAQNAYLYYIINNASEEDGENITTLSDETDNGRDANTTSPALTPTISNQAVYGSTVKMLNCVSGKCLNTNITGSGLCDADFEMLFGVKLSDGIPGTTLSLFGALESGNNSGIHFLVGNTGTIQYVIGNDTDGKVQALSNTVVLADGANENIIFRAKVSYTDNQVYLYMDNILLTLDVTKNGDISGLTPANWDNILTMLLGNMNTNGSRNESAAINKYISKVAFFDSLLSDSDAESVQRQLAGWDLTSTASRQGLLKDGTNLDGVHDVQVATISGTEYAFCCGKGGTFASVNISDPTTPVLADSFTSNFTNCQAVYIDGNYAYVGIDGAIVSVNISDPANMTEADRLSDVAIARVNGIDKLGDKIIFSNKDGYLHTIDVADPENLASLDTFDCSVINAGASYGSPHDVLIFNGRYAAVPFQSADTTKHFALIDITGGGSSILAAGSWSITGTIADHNDMDGANRVMISGNYIYIGCNISELLAVVDCSTPASPSVVSKHKLKAGRQGLVGLTLCDNTNYLIGTASDGIEIYNIEDPTAVYSAFVWQDRSGDIDGTEGDMHEGTLNNSGNFVCGLQDSNGITIIELGNNFK